MSKSLLYVEASGLKMTLADLSVKTLKGEALTDEEKIVEEFLKERIERIEKDISSS